MTRKTTDSKNTRLDKIVAEAHKNRKSREQGYRERALKMYPWICGRCEREFTRENVRELTVHHRNHDHDFNPDNGSNWELLCVFCHDNEHQRQLEANGLVSGSEGGADKTRAGHKAFADLSSLLKNKK